MTSLASALSSLLPPCFSLSPPLISSPLSSFLHQLLQQATSSSNLGAFSGIQQMAGESARIPGEASSSLFLPFHPAETALFVAPLLLFFFSLLGRTSERRNRGSTADELACRELREIFALKGLLTVAENRLDLLMRPERRSRLDESGEREKGTKGAEEKRAESGRRQPADLLLCRLAPSSASTRPSSLRPPRRSLRSICCQIGGVGK